MKKLFAVLLTSITALSQTGYSAATKYPLFTTGFVNFHPVGIFTGTVTGDLGFALNDHWATGLSVSHTEAKVENDGYSGSSLGGLVSYFLYDIGSNTPYLKLGADKGFLNIDADKASATAEKGNAFVNYGMLKLLGGYHWVWLSGINVNLAGGFTYANLSSTTSGERNVNLGTYKTLLPRTNYNGFLPTAELTVGLLLGKI